MKEIFSFENLYEAYRMTRRGKRAKSCVIRYELHALEATKFLADRISDRTYRMGKCIEFTVHEPKKRLIRAPLFRDRVVQQCLCKHILEPELDHRLIYDTYACRKGKGTHKGLDRLEEMLRKHYRKNGTSGYFIKGDIAKYFKSIDHKELKNRMYPLLSKHKIEWILDQTIDNEQGVGINLGFQSSQWYANFYMSSFDHFVKEKLKVKHYIRYMDDWMAIVDSKEEANRILLEMKRYLKSELKLDTNKKTQIFPVKNGLDFLGFHTYLTDSGKVIRKIRRSSKQAMNRKMKTFKKKYKSGRITKDQIDRSYSSWTGHASHGNCYKLRIDMDKKYKEIFKED
ncbi:reverse transcriptase [Andreesenia angusta]|uniref:Reverse transcriptase n=2 Tax=Andreesenia angusta TaxID=39480 RepID=A0A1S1V910_9FIRM|nr:reverse transcriptase [Andreesenia angusta]